jgi:hypothetical protein
MFWTSLPCLPPAQSSETSATICHSTFCTASQPRRLEFSTLPCEPQTTYLVSSKTAASKTQLCHQHTTDILYSSKVDDTEFALLCTDWHCTYRYSAIYIGVLPTFNTCNILTTCLNGFINRYSPT